MRVGRNPLGLVALLGCASLAGAAASEPAAPAASAPAQAEPATVALMKVVARLEPGSQWVVAEAGMFCSTRKILDWAGDAGAFKPQTFRPAFRDEMHRAGFHTQGDSVDLFATESENVAAPDYSVGALITSMQFHACYPDPQGRNLDKVKGDGSMAIEWQIFSRLQHQVVARISTSGKFEQRTAESGGLVRLLSGAFAENARQLAVSPDFKHAIEAGVQTSDATPEPGDASPIVLAGREHPTSIPAAVNSVVLVYGGQGEGSGFLISKDGYVLTDLHVVGALKEVKLRWSDGSETVGQVVRRSRARDVALIRTDPRGHAPLALRMVVPEVGEPVFAIGAPLGKDFQGTVTRGALSATRTLDGATYIQSDVHVAPGSSGGPLLDEQGRVIGIHESKAFYPVVVQAKLLGEAPSDVNLFIPIGEAAKALGLKLG